MAAEFNRTERIAEAIQKTLTQILLQKITDPTLRFITFTAVKVSRDLSFADIQFTQLHEASSPQQKALSEQMTLKRLQQLSTRLRYLLAQQLNLRIVPKLRFFYDYDQEKSLHLHNLIDQAVAQDEKKRAK